MSGRKADRTVDVSRPRGEVFDVLVRVLPTVKGMRVERIDAQAGLILARAGFSLASYGETVRLVVATGPDGGSRLSITSSLRWGLVDWGKNRTNIDRILLALDGALAAAPSPGAPPPIPPPPTP